MGNTAMVSTHDARLAGLADRVIDLHDGTITAG